jgi:hypothetical protein
VRATSCTGHTASRSPSSTPLRRAPASTRPATCRASSTRRSAWSTRRGWCGVWPTRPSGSGSGVHEDSPVTGFDADIAGVHGAHRVGTRASRRPGRARHRGLPRAAEATGALHASRLRPRPHDRAAHRRSSPPWAGTGARGSPMPATSSTTTGAPSMTGCSSVGTTRTTTSRGGSTRAGAVRRRTTCSRGTSSRSSPSWQGLRFTHRWAGVIDTTSRFTPVFGTALGGRLAYAVGYTGLGVARPASVRRSRSTCSPAGTPSARLWRWCARSRCRSRPSRSGTSGCGPPGRPGRRGPHRAGATCGCGPWMPSASASTAAPWPSSPCASCSRAASTSGTRPAAGTPR